MSTWEYSERELWRFGEQGISIYHVFSTVAVGQTVLVFAEARHGGGADSADVHDICMRKSTDGGRSFADSVCILEANGTHCYVNPTPVFDAETGRLFLFFAENLGNTHTEVYVMHSDDLGESFSVPRSVTAGITGATGLSFHLPGPGHGIQLQRGAYRGRLLLQLWHRGSDVTLPRTERGYCVSLLYSDDHGESWAATPAIGHALCCNESRLIETRDGVLWSLRSFGTVHALCRSTDGGLHFCEPVQAPLPAAAACDTGAISLDAGGAYADTVLLSRITNTKKSQRRDMEIRISTDGGQSFPRAMPLLPGDAMPGYSDLCVIGEGEPIIGLLHCRADHVLFSRISMQALTGGEFDGTQRSVWLNL